MRIAPEGLRQRAAALAPEMVELRHELHRNPETGFKETDTARTIRAFLSGTRAEVLPPLIGTDTVALLRGSAPGRNLLLRADIDALPLQDKSDLPWRSTREGRAHACGHDGHTAMLLGAAKLLDGLADELAGSVRLVFQPAEEEEGGGRLMIAKGLLDAEPRPDAAFALHGWAGMPARTIGAAGGAVMAAADKFVLTVKGRGGHGALPHRAEDPVLAAAELVTSLQSVVSRSVDPLEPAVLSVCAIHGGHASNVIPDEVSLEGTVRYFDRSLRALVEERMEKIAGGVCAAHGCAHSLVYEAGYIPLVNDAGMVGFARRVAEGLFGAGTWDEASPRTMGAEDFAYYLEKIPGALLRLGLGEEWPRLHSPQFDFNDEAIETGIALLAGLALEFSFTGASL
jgi:amidohydrolase